VGKRKKGEGSHQGDKKGPASDLLKIEKRRGEKEGTGRVPEGGGGAGRKKKFVLQRELEGKKKNWRRRCWTGEKRGKVPRRRSRRGDCGGCFVQEGADTPLPGRRVKGRGSTSWGAKKKKTTWEKKTTGRKKRHFPKAHQGHTKSPREEENVVASGIREKGRSNLPWDRKKNGKCFTQTLKQGKKKATKNKGKKKDLNGFCPSGREEKRGGKKTLNEQKGARSNTF